MEIEGEETYELPIYDFTLFHLTSSGEASDSREGDPDDDPMEGTLTIREMTAKSGDRTLSVVHHVDGERLGRYRFEVVDRARRLCRHAGNESPPWPVYRAVTEYGYYCQTSSDSGRTYAFDLLHAGCLELLQLNEGLEHEYLTGMSRRLFGDLYQHLMFSAVEYQVGGDRMEDVVSWLAEHRGDGRTLFEYDTFVSVIEEFGESSPFFPHSLRHPSTESFRSKYGGAGTPAGTESDDGESLAWKAVQHRGLEEHEDEIYVSIVGADAIDRFSFGITDESAGECVAQTNLVGDFPPYSVIESVGPEFEVTNVPSPSADGDDQYGETLLRIDRIVRRVSSLFPPESGVTERTYDEYLATLELCLSVAAAYERAPLEYDSGVSRAFTILDVEYTAENVCEMKHEHVDQISTAAFQSVDDDDTVERLAREWLKTARTERRRGVDPDTVHDLSLLRGLYEPHRNGVP